MIELKYNVDFILPSDLDNFKVSNEALLGSSILFENTIPGIFFFVTITILLKLE